MARAQKTVANPPDVEEIARRLREGMLNDGDVAPDDVPKSRGLGVYGPNIEFHLTDLDGSRRFTVLVFQSR